MSEPILRLGSKGQAVREWQEILHEQGLGAICGTVDGAFGVRTDAATRQFQARHGRLDNGVVNATTREAAAEGPAAPAIVGIAESQLGVKEATRNQGKEIAKYWPATDYPEGHANREPWCAAFIAWCVQQAGIEPRPRSAAVANWVKDALKLKWTVFGPGDPLLFPRAGDLVVFKFSHIGLVTGRAGYDVQTIEGNTNEHGEREGKFVMRHERSMRSECKSFIRLPAGKTLKI
jgi:hypothetical protein